MDGARNGQGFKNKLKRHKDAVLHLHSIDGADGSILISGSADHSVRVWDLKTNFLSQRIDIQRPTEDKIMKYKNSKGDPSFQKPDRVLMNKEYMLPRAKQNRFIICFCFKDQRIYTGYDDGLILCWNYETGEMVFPMIGHTNRVNCIVNTQTQYMLSTSNDCSIRQWDYESGVNTAIFKFGDPISVARVSSEYNMLFTASWDKMIRCIDLDSNKVMKTFIGSREAIKCLEIVDNFVFVAGTDPIIRSFNLATGATKEYKGHKGWIYNIIFHGKRMFSGGDDRIVIIWDIETTNIVETLAGHMNGVTSLALCNGDLFSGSFDHYILQWDLEDIEERIMEKEHMKAADIESKKLDVYWKVIEGNKKSKKSGAAKTKSPKKKKK